MTATPFMQLYIADYLGDTLHLTTEQHGAYLLILMAMWRAEGRLPNDPSKLARIARVTPRRWHLIAGDVMEFFDVDGEEITQKRLVEERKKAVSISEKRSASGKLGGAAKALKNNNVHVTNAKQTPQHSQIPYTRIVDTDVSPKREIESEFEEFWSVYPRKVGKDAARRKFAAARKLADFETILAGTRRYASERFGQDPNFTKHAATWLYGGCWADEPTPSMLLPRQTAPPREETMADFTGNLLRTMKNGTDPEHTGPTIAASNAAGDHRAPAPAFRLTSD